MKPEPIVFFGTSQLSLAAIKALEPDFRVELLVTKPDSRLHGRVQTPIVKSWAKPAKVPVWQPKGAVELEKMMQDTHQLTSRIGVVIDYGLIISSTVIAAF